MDCLQSAPPQRLCLIKARRREPALDDPKGGWGPSIFSAKDQTEVERLTADPIILDDVGARYEILLMKQLWMKGPN